MGGPSLSIYVGSGSERYGSCASRLAPAKLAEAMGEMLQPEVRARFAELGYQRVETFSPAACAGTLLDFLSGRFGLGR